MPSNVPLSFNRDRTERQLDARLDELLEKLRRNRPSEDPWMVRRAYEIAAERHRDQVRSSGDPYLLHLLEVAHILADLRLDATTLTAALLHDSVEDTQYPVSRIEERFGEEVAHLVEGVTKIARLDMMSSEARQAENVRKMLLAMVNDVRVVLVKLADRLHNMRTLEFLDSQRQQRIARETLDIYAPIAHRLGMGLIRGELEDLAFRYLEPEAFFALQKEVTQKAPVHQKFLEEVQATIRSKLVESGIPAELEARVKSLYSLHRKIVRQERGLEQVYDLLAVRVITDSERNCYAALGVVHHIWRPVPGRFKDYLAMPRPNLYQSLHTTVLHSGQAFEVQIRTQDMHRIAEEGVAAHWKYKTGKPGAGEGDDQRITWMRQLIEWSRELEEPGEFLSTLKVDLTPIEVYAFTPKGRVLELPRGASPVDFAYLVHTEVGHQCVGAKVNGQMVSLRHEIMNGDVVEILTQKGHHPSRDWLGFVRSSHTKTKIRQWLNIQERAEAREMGKRLLEAESRHFGRSLKKIPEEDLLKVATDYGLSRVEDLFGAVGFGKYSARQVLTKALGDAAKLTESSDDNKPTLVKTVKRMLGIGEAPLVVKGHDDLLVYRAKCCNPIPGDEIVGYITRGRGVAVHNRMCSNVQNLMYQVERRIAVEWGGASTATFPVQLTIRAKDRAGLLAEITAVISGAGSNIHSLESRPDKTNARIDANLEIADKRQLETILANIRKISGIFGVERVTQVH
jgi:GTP diphosphokinase / guanosine-3',5'-bis(diphosphate) 3'-diphosphatase